MDSLPPRAIKFLFTFNYFCIFAQALAPVVSILMKLQLLRASTTGQSIMTHRRNASSISTTGPSWGDGSISMYRMEIPLFDRIELATRTGNNDHASWLATRNFPFCAHVGRWFKHLCKVPSMFRPSSSVHHTRPIQFATHRSIQESPGVVRRRPLPVGRKMFLNTYTIQRLEYRRRHNHQLRFTSPDRLDPNFGPAPSTPELLRSGRLHRCRSTATGSTRPVFWYDAGASSTLFNAR